MASEAHHTGTARLSGTVRGNLATKPQPRHPEREAGRRERPELGVLDRRHVLERAKRRQARVLLGLSALCLAVPLMLAAVGHAVVASSQVKADGIQSKIATSLQTQQNLQLDRATLMAPDRILTIAENQLHMITEPKVTYLVPIDPGQSVLQSHSAGSLALASGVVTPARPQAHKPKS